jgi:putative ABC transport system permease protein
MNFIELIKLSINALRKNVLRTLLTMLGIIIGIASVIIIMSLGEGTTASIVDRISSFGANNVTISPGRRRMGPVQSGGTVTTLVRDDAEEIIKRVPNVIEASSTVSGRYQLVANGENSNNSVSGVDAAHQIVSNLEMVSGTFFDQGQVNGASRVAVLGDEVVEELYGEDSAEHILGESLKIDSRPFRIIGVVNESSSVYVPITTAMSVLVGRDYVDSITVMMSDSVFVETAESDIQALLMDRHDITDPDLIDFSIRSAQEMISTVSEITGNMTTMLSAIAAISLVVGGIGIMNIMLVTVTERTKEIGLLKAIGAKRKHILTQFLIEAVVLTLVGGLIGMTLGLVITSFIAQMLNIPFIIGYKAIMLAVGVSTGVGIVFGFYPAQRAAKLNPIDALRYE